jgi:hypothetical protein
VSAAAPPNKRQKQSRRAAKGVWVLTNLEQVKITEAGGIEAVVAAMKAHKTSVLVQEQVCRALMNLATTATRSR